MISESAFGRPSFAHAVGQRVQRNASFSGPFAETLASAVQCQELGAPRIARLFVSWHPSTVARLVIAVVVDTLNRMTVRARIHVGLEVLEVLPSFADRNSSTSVVVELWMWLVGASTAHVFPSVINRCRLLVGAIAVLLCRSTSGADLFRSQAAAALTLASAQEMCPNGASHSAVTGADVARVMPIAFSPFAHRPSSEPLAVQDWAHSLIVAR